MRNRLLYDRPFYDIVLLAIFSALFFGATLGMRPYSAPSESRYIEIGREMAESGNYVTPRLNYVKYFEKPPLFYWVQAAWTKIAGTGFFESRVPTAFFSGLLVLLTYGLGRILAGRLTGILSALVFATCLYVFALSRVVLLDVPVSVFLVATLMAFLYAADAPEGSTRRLVTYLMYAAAALAVLTKGLIGMVIPGAVIFLWLCATGRWNLLLQMRLVSGTVLFLLITVPWHVIVWQHNPEHPWFYFVHEHWLRYTTPTHGREHPVWFFVPVLLLGLFPWIVFAWPAFRTYLKGCWAQRKQDGRPMFLALWVGFIFLFFSASDSTLIPYILPIFPPLAVMIGNYLALNWREVKTSGFRACIYLMLLLLLAVAFLPDVVEDMLDQNSKAYQAIEQGESSIRYLSAIALIGAIGLFLAYMQGRTRHVICVMIAVTALVTQMGDIIAANYSKDSMQEFAFAISGLMKPGDEVASYDHYYQDLPIYLNRRITVVHWRGELEFGTQNEDTSAWMISHEEFWKRWLAKDHAMFVVMRQDAVDRINALTEPSDKHMLLLKQEGRNFLYSNLTAEELANRIKKQ